MDLRGTKLVKEMHHLPKGTSSFSTQYCLNCCMIAAGAIHLMTLGVSTTLPFDSLNFLSPKGRSLMICDDVIKSKKMSSLCGSILCLSCSLQGGGRAQP